MDTEAIIDRLGGTNKTAEICGVTPTAVTLWKRGGIPHARWSTIVDYAREHRIDGITFDAIQTARVEARAP